MFRFMLSLVVASDMIGSDVMTPTVRNAFIGTFLNITDIDPSDIVEVSLFRKSMNVPTRRRVLSVGPAFNEYELAYVVDTNDATEAKHRLDSSIQEHYVSNVSASTLFAEIFLIHLNTTDACVYANETSDAPYVWSRPLHVINNITFFAIDHDLGTNVGELVKEQLTSDGYMDGEEYEFRCELHGGFFLALCLLNTSHPGANNVSTPLIVSLTTVDPVVSVEDLNSGASDNIVLFLTVVTTIATMIVVTTIAILYYVFCYKMRRNIRDREIELVNAKSKLRAHKDNNELLKQGWIISFDEIKLNERIGEGAAGEVWDAMLRDSMRVAVKTVKDSSSLDILNDKEVSFMRLVRNPRLVLFLGCGRTDESNIFIVLEYMSAGSMNDKLWLTPCEQDEEKKEQLCDVDVPAWSQRLQWLVDVAEGMAYLQEDMVCCHRDLKSPNVLLSPESGLLRAKVADFGVSKFVSGSTRKAHATREIEKKKTDPETNDSEFQRQVSRRKMVGKRSKLMSTRSSSVVQDKAKGLWTSRVGTIEWLAPELLTVNESYSPTLSQVTEYDQAVDQYSFGCIMYEALELRPPWSHDAMFRWSVNVFDAVLRGDRPPHASPCPNGYVALMERCWEREPSKRPKFSSIRGRLETMLENEKSAESLARRHTQSANEARRSTYASVDSKPDASKDEDDGTMI